ncbi:DMT family transporter [Novipirellula caenicola]|uniref:Inner membrane protein YdcZ n=1 Tax=Novipirellula caenicola TaxID=1536901 RepID=A0ABP9VRX0_9BACT
MQHASGMLWVAILVGLAAGCVLGVQPSVNGSLGKAVSHPYQAALISFAVGTGLLLILCLFTGVFPPSFQSSPGQLPWWIWSGGAIGVVVVTTSLFFVPRVGSVPWFAAIMTGQTLAAILLDHYGWLGNPQASASPLRMLGVGLLVAGVLVIAQAKRSEQAAKRSELAAQRSEQNAEQTAKVGDPASPISTNPRSSPVVESTNSE